MFEFVVNYLIGVLSLGTDGEIGKLILRKKKVKKRAAPDSNSENEETVSKVP